MRWSLAILLLPTAVSLILCLPSRLRHAASQVVLVGTVRDDRGAPVSGARVRCQGHSEFALTDASGRFGLLMRRQLPPSKVIAAKQGYLIGPGQLSSDAVDLCLPHLPGQDSEAYIWVSPTPSKSNPGNCGNCHEALHAEWSASGHARSVRNRHFQDLYAAGRSWNLMSENPDGVGVCTACHAPSLKFDDPAYYDLRKATGVEALGVHCDYCHKVRGVPPTPVGLTHGRFGLDLLRPSSGQLFFGPLDDVDRGEDSYAPIYRDSKYCASCHEGVVFGVHVYSTYSEWLTSPARRHGKQCQTCHMAPTGTLTNLAPGKGGIERDPLTLGNHRFFAGSQLQMLRHALQLETQKRVSGERVTLDVVLTARDVGHAIPTGFIDRHLILAVEAIDSTGEALPSIPPSPVLPSLAGNLKGKAGKIYGKITRNFEGKSPAPFWRAQPDMDDTRLTPGKPDRLHFIFSPSAARTRIRVIYRRFWDQVACAKGWDDNELEVLSLEVP